MPAIPIEEQIREEFPEPIIEWLGQWDEPEAKQRWAKRCRSLLRKHGGDVKAVLMDLDQPVW